MFQFWIETTDTIASDKVEELYTVGHVPDDGRVGELQHDDEADTDEDEGEVGEHHQAAHALGVGAEGVGCGHGLHRQPRLRRVLGLDGAHPARCRHVRPHTLPAAGRDKLVKYSSSYFNNNHCLNLFPQYLLDYDNDVKCGGEH